VTLYLLPDNFLEASHGRGWSDTIRKLLGDWGVVQMTLGCWRISHLDGSTYDMLGRFVFWEDFGTVEVSFGKAESGGIGIGLGLVDWWISVLIEEQSTGSRYRPSNELWLWL
jgi:hypothetical protein